MTGKEIIEKLQNRSEMNPTEHDGSYELVQEAVKYLDRADKENLDYKDLDMLYLMTIGTWKSSFKNKKNKVRNSNLNEEDKNKMIELIKNIKQKSINNEYGNHEDDKVGMFGTGFLTFNRSGDSPSQTEVRHVVEMCNKILLEDNEEECINIVGNYLEEEIYGLKTPSLSQILHCIKPLYFPILNTRGIRLYKEMGVELEEPKSLTTYSDNVRKIRQFRDDNFSFKNYRIIDLFVMEDFDEEQDETDGVETNKSTSDTKYWKVLAGESGEQWDNFIEGNYIGIGWPKIDYKQGNLLEQIKKQYPERDANLLKKWFDYFIDEMKQGDIVIIYGSGKFTIGKVVSEYYLKQKEHMKNRRKVKWLLNKPVNAKKYGEKLYNTLKQQFTVVPIDNPEFINIFENKVLNSENVNDQEEKEKKKYFWITAKPEIWGVNKIKDGGEVFYTAFNKKGNKRRIFSAFKEAQPGDEVIFYESSPEKNVVALGEIVKGLHEEEEYGKQMKGISIKYVRDVVPISWSQLTEVEELKESKPILNKAQGSLFALSKDEYENILALEDVPDERQKVRIPTVNFNKKLELNNLYFPTKEKEILLRRIQTNLKNGKHIILTGPPGTGKSKLAKEICNNFVKDNYNMVTASSDWSTFDTIGGYKPDKSNNLIFNNGVFLDCFKEQESSDNKWLIIDEINRADIDKAFGSLFSALTGDKIKLSFKANNNKNIVVMPEGNNEIIPWEHQYIIPKDWRIIATMNTFDKTSLYEMSYAFMRRFAFIPVSVPNKINEELIINYLNYWDPETNGRYVTEITKLWNKINNIRKVGPAIIEDIYKYIIKTEDDYASTIISYVLPQFEGIRNEKLEEFIVSLSELDFLSNEDIKLIQEFANDYFRLGGVNF